MRQERTVPASIFDVFAGHEIGRELKAMSAWLDTDRALLGVVAADLRREGVKETGRQGLPAEAVLRCALLKQYRQLSYQELAFQGLRLVLGGRLQPRPPCASAISLTPTARKAGTRCAGRSRMPESPSAPRSAPRHPLRPGPCP